MAKSNGLPNEVLQRIFRHAIGTSPGADVTHLWTTARQVCRSWRANVAQAFLDNIVRDPTRCDIYFEMPWVSRMELVFERLHENDTSRAVFRETEESRRILKPIHDDQRSAPSRQKRDKYSNWKQNVRGYLNKQRPQYRHGTFHVISVDGIAADTPLAGLKISTKRLEIAIDWEAMLTAFYSEDAECQRRLQLTKEDVFKHINPVINNNDAPEQDLLKTFHVANQRLQHVRRNVRRDRTRRHCMKTNQDSRCSFCSDDFEKWGVERGVWKRIANRRFPRKTWEQEVYERENGNDGQPPPDVEEWPQGIVELQTSEEHAEGSKDEKFKRYGEGRQWVDLADIEPFGIDDGNRDPRTGDELEDIEF